MAYQCAPPGFDISNVDEATMRKALKKLLEREGLAPKATASKIVQKCAMYLNIFTVMTKDEHQPQIVRLVQSLISGEIGADEFMNRLQNSFGEGVAEVLEEKSGESMKCLVPFLKKTLPSLRKALVDRSVSIQGIEFGETEATLCNQRLIQRLSLKRRADGPLSPKISAKNQRSDVFPFLSLPPIILDQILNDFDYSTCTKLTVLNSICHKITALLHPTKRIHPFHLHFDAGVPMITLNWSLVNDQQFIQLLPNIINKLSIQEIIITEEEDQEGYASQEEAEQAEVQRNSPRVVAKLFQALAASPAFLKNISKVLTSIRINEVGDTTCICPFLSACSALQSLEITGIFLPISNQLGMSLADKELKSLTYDCESDREALQLVSRLKPGALEDLTVFMSMDGVLEEHTVAKMNQSGALENVKKLTLVVYNDSGEQRDYAIQWAMDMTQLAQLQTASVIVGILDLQFEQVQEAALRWFSAHTEGPERTFTISRGHHLESVAVYKCDLTSYPNLKILPINANIQHDLVKLEFTQGNSKFVVDRVRLMLCEDEEEENEEEPQEQEECLVCRSCPRLLIRNLRDVLEEGEEPPDLTKENQHVEEQCCITACSEAEVRQMLGEWYWRQNTKLEKNGDGSYTVRVSKITFAVPGRACGLGTCLLCK